MDMVNDGKDIHLDTPQAVKEALASGKDLDDPNLLAVIDNPDFDLYEDIVGGLNYTGYIMGPMLPERRKAWTRPQKSPRGRRITSPSTATVMTRS